MLGMSGAAVQRLKSLDVRAAVRVWASLRDRACVKLRKNGRIHLTFRAVAHTRISPEG